MDASYLRLGFRLVVMLGAVASPLIAVGFYTYGAIFLVLLFGVPLALFICARVLIRRRLEGSPALLTVARSQIGRAGAALHRARRHRRVQRVEEAASRAGEINEFLSPEGVQTGAVAVFRLVHQAWRERDDRRLAVLLGPALLAESEGRLSRAFGQASSALVGDVEIAYVGFATGEEPHAIVLIEAALRDDRSADQSVRTFGQYWTLAYRQGLWTVLDIEERREGRYHLLEPIGAPPIPSHRHGNDAVFVDRAVDPSLTSSTQPK